jgi:thymidine phosphorylase
LANVKLTLAEMKQMVAEVNACIAWGGALSLAPVDDIIISVERPLNLDSEGQMVASILSKKRAAGSTHMILDIPIGPTAKVRSIKDADRLKMFFEKVAKRIGLKVRVVYTDGSQPVGRGIGPYLEAQEVLKVLRNDPDAPVDLRDKSVFLAGELLELSGKVKKGKGVEIAAGILQSGKAYEKFMRIVEKQGGMKALSPAPYSHQVFSQVKGRVKSIHNQKIAKVAKLAGAPNDIRAGVYLHAKVGENVEGGSPLFQIYAETEGELKFAIQYVKDNPEIIRVS